MREASPLSAPFCHFTPDQWQEIGHEYDEVRHCMPGWDITDYGMGDFDKFDAKTTLSRKPGADTCITFEELDPALIDGSYGRDMLLDVLRIIYYNLISYLPKIYRLQCRR